MKTRFVFLDVWAELMTQSKNPFRGGVENGGFNISMLHIKKRESPL